MTPPPPPFRFARGKDDVAFDPALGDEDLVAARAALAQGRWSDVRSLLARTGPDWDARGHRLVVLGDPDRTDGDARLEWVDGGIARDRAALEGEIDRRVAAYIASRRTQTTPRHEGTE